MIANLVPLRSGLPIRLIASISTLSVLFSVAKSILNSFVANGTPCK